MQEKNILRSNISTYRLNIWIFIFLSVCTIPVFFGNDSFCAEAGSYKVEFQGVKDKDLLSRIHDLSRTLEMAAKPVDSINILRRRAREDIDLFKRFLKSEGYLSADINEKIDTSRKPWEVKFILSLNAPFIVTSVNVFFTSNDLDNIRVPDISKTGITLNQVYRSKTVLEGEKKLLFLIKKQGFPHPTIEKREIVADHETQSVTIEFQINPGQKAYFGDTVIKGLENIDQTFIMKFIPWKRGDVYDPDLLTSCYEELTNLWLFSTVRISEAKELVGNSLPIEIQVNERKHNSVSVGLKYHTDEGPGIKFSWENRNLFGGGEKIGLLFNYSNYITTLENLFKKPAFMAKEQTLRLSIQKSYEDPDAYTSDSLSGSIFIDRELSEKLDVSGGMTYKYSKIDQLDTVNHYSILSMPLYLSLNNSDDILDPLKGERLAFRLIPYYDLSVTSLFYMKGLVNFRYYLKLTSAPLISFAGSITVGMIRGAARDEIPADERFFVGGGGSVRGYPYQSVGPLSGATPLGGKSMFETSFEARLRMTRRLGFVLFLDGGTAYSERLFDPDEDIRWGTGVGFRYYTPIGPLRFDVGLPLNRRDGIDDSFQVYISIGQAF